MLNIFYQSFILDCYNYRILDIREFVKNHEKNESIMSMTSFVQSFAFYGYSSNKLAITFKKDLKFSKVITLAMLKYIIKVSNTRNKLELKSVQSKILTK